MILKDHLADSLLLILIDCIRKNGKPFFVLCKSFFQLRSDHSDILFTNLLFICKYSFFHFLRSYDLPDRCKQLFRNCTALISMLWLSNLSNDLINKLNDRLVDLMSLVDCFDHSSFRNLIGSCFDHDHLFSGGGNCQVQVSLLPLLLAWVDNEFSVYHANLSHSTGSIKRNIGNAGCYCSTKHGNKLGTACRIYTHNHIIQSNIISVILGKQRTHGSVNNTACQDSILTCLSFSLIKASGNFTYGIKLLFIFYTKWEEINSIPWFLRCCCSG